MVICWWLSPEVENPRLEKAGVFQTHNAEDAAFEDACTFLPGTFSIWSA